MNKSRNPRSKGNQRKLAVQICLLLGVCVWLIFQMKQSHSTKKHENGENVTHKSEIGNEAQKLGRKYLHPHSHEKSESTEHEQEEEEGEEEEDHTHDEDKSGGNQEKLVENIKEKQNESEGQENKHEADEDEEQEHEGEEGSRRETEDGKDPEKEEMDDVENEAEDVVGQDAEEVEEEEAVDGQRKNWESLVPPAQQAEVEILAGGQDGQGAQMRRASRKEEQQQHMEDEQNAAMVDGGEPRSNHTAGGFTPSDSKTVATDNRSHHLHHANGWRNMTANDSLLLLTSKTVSASTGNMHQRLLPLETDNFV